MAFWHNRTPGKVATKRTRRKKTWLDEAAKDASPMINQLKQSNAVIQAAIIHHATNIPIDAKDIIIQSPSDKLEAKLLTDAIDKIQPDEEFLEEYKEALLDKVRENASGRRNHRRSKSDGADFEGAEDMRFGFQRDYPSSPMELVTAFQELKAAMKGETGGLGGLLDSPIALEFVKIIPSLINKGAPALAAGPQTIMVEVEGKMVEMTRQGYELHKQQRAQILRLQAPTSVSIPPAAEPASTNRAVSESTTAPPSIKSVPADPAVSPPAETPPVQPSSTVEEIPPQPQLPPEAVSAIVAIATVFLKGMEGSPEVFAKKLYADKLTGEQDSVFIFNLLLGLDGYDDTIAKLQAFKAQPEFKPFIAKIEKGRPWVEVVLAKIKELNGEDDGG